MQASFSLTVGVFLGAALTSGFTCGILAFYFANENVVRRLRVAAKDLATTARDAVLSTEEGQAIKLAVLKTAGREAGAAQPGNVVEPAAASQTTPLHELVASGRKVVCVGTNYRDHISEMSQLGPDWKLEEEPDPVLFLKPSTAIAWPGSPIVLPRSARSGTYGVQHELELGLIIGKRASCLADDDSALATVAGFVLALDVTDRDAQTEAKVKGMPWTVAKGRDTFLPLSEPFLLAPGEDWRSLKLSLRVNNEAEPRQHCEPGAMIHSLPALLRYISSVMTLEPGDLVITGTPAGVGRLLPGDCVRAVVEGHVKMVVNVVEEAD